MNINNLQVRIARIEAEMQAIRTELLALNKQTPSKQSPTLADLGISREEAIAIRYQFGAMAEDWDSPEMDVYNDICLQDNDMSTF